MHSEPVFLLDEGMTNDGGICFYATINMQLVDELIGRALKSPRKVVTFRLLQKNKEMIQGEEREIWLDLYFSVNRVVSITHN